MLLTPHVLTGLAIAYKIPNPLISLPLAMASHQFLDLIPHDDLGTGNESGILDNGHANLFVKGKLKLNWRHAVIFTDALIAASAVLYFGLLYRNFWLFVAAAALSAWSDILRAPYFLLGWKNKIYKFADKIDGSLFHSQEKGVWGKAVQAAVSIVALAILFNSFPWIN